MTYFAPAKPKVWLPLDRDATARSQGADPKTEDASWHPHVLLDGRPTKGALDVITRYEAQYLAASEAARLRLGPQVTAELKTYSAEEIAEEIDEELARAIAEVELPPTVEAAEAAVIEARRQHPADLAKVALAEATLANAKGYASATEDQRKMMIRKKSNPHFTNPRTHREHTLGILVWRDAAVVQAIAETNAVRVAVCIHSIGGDWSCYASSWGKDVSWPNVDDMDARLEFVARLAGEDIVKINEAAEGLVGVTDDEAKKSEAQPDSCTPEETAQAS